MNQLNETIWHSICHRLANKGPQWVREVVCLPFSEIEKLPQLDREGECNCSFKPSLELEEITPDFIAFLSEQVRLSPRGKEWSDILSARIKALTPYQNKKLYWLILHRRHDGRLESCDVRLTPENFSIVHFES